MQSCLQEQHAVNNIASQLADRIVAAPHVDQSEWIAGTWELFEEFRAHFVRHIALEESDGYLSPVTDLRPSLLRQIQRLGNEHHQICQLMKSIAGDLAWISPEDHLLILDVRHRIRALLEYINHHESGENVITVKAFNEDLGSSGD